KKLRPLRVYILGAGVSAAGGIPVAKDIFRATMKRLVVKHKSSADEVHQVLRYLYPGFEAKFNSYPNIEDFLNFLEMGKTFNTEEFVRSEPYSEERIRRVEKIVLRSCWSNLHKAGLHTFRHGLGTARANAGVCPAVVRRTLRHTDIKTTLRFYVHA